MARCIRWRHGPSDVNCRRDWGWDAASGTDRIVETNSGSNLNGAIFGDGAPELDYTEQTSWILFLKYLDDLEQERALAAVLVSKPYSFVIDKQHLWSKWAAHGNFDHDKALTGDDLIATRHYHDLDPMTGEEYELQDLA
jgi:hypothetical protein